MQHCVVAEGRNSNHTLAEANPFLADAKPLEEPVNAQQSAKKVTLHERGGVLPLCASFWPPAAMTDQLLSTNTWEPFCAHSTDARTKNSPERKTAIKAQPGGWHRPQDPTRSCKRIA